MNSPIPEQAWLEAKRDALESDTDLDFRKKGGRLSQGNCPNCGNRELWADQHLNWLRCNRQTNCGFEQRVVDRYPAIAPSLMSTYQPKPGQIAQSYLTYQRGLLVDGIQGAFEEATYYDKETSVSWICVKFPLPENRAWLRLIQTADGKPHQGGDKSRFLGKYQGLHWAQPSFDPQNTTEIWITEGIFNALSLTQAQGKTAVATLSSSNEPTQLLDQLFEIKKNPPKLVIAFDNDPPNPKTGKRAGLFAAKRLLKKCAEINLYAELALPPEGVDWNDLHKAGQLTDQTLKEALLRGLMEMAKSAKEYGFYLYQETHRKKQVFAWGLKTWAWEASKSDAAAPGIGTKYDNDFDAICFPIARFALHYLYGQEDRNSGEFTYYARCAFADAPPTDVEFEASQLTSLNTFRNALLAKAHTAYFEGDQNWLNILIARWFEHSAAPIKVVPFAGYDEANGIYIFPQVAYDAAGKAYSLNLNRYFELPNQLRIKCGHIEANKPFVHSEDLNLSWIPDFHLAFGHIGFFQIAFFTASLFANQIRAAYEGFPFNLLIGLAGTGKTAAVKFCWQLFGRPGWQGIALSKSSTDKGFSRELVKTSGIPVVYLEGNELDPSKTKNSFDYESLKPLYEGGNPFVRALKTNDNQTYSPPFLGSLMIVQNGDITGSQALSERFVSIRMNKAHFTAAGKEAHDRLKLYTGDLSGFRHHLLQHHNELQSSIFQLLPEAYKHLQEEAKAQRCPISNSRIIHNHAIMLATGGALFKLIPQLAVFKEGWKAFITRLAIEREQVSALDRPLVRLFFDVLLDLLPHGIQEFKRVTMPPVNLFRLNHAQPGEQHLLLKLNLTQCVDEMGKRQVRFADLNQLKAELHSSTRFKFVDASKSTKSWSGDSVRCWIFEIPKDEQLTLETILREFQPKHGQQQEDLEPFK